MKLFLSPFKPLSYLVALAVLLILVPLGRFYGGDGSLWTIFGGFALTALFILASTRWSALNQLGASFSAWMNSATITAVIAAVVLGVSTAASSIYNQFKSPYYQAYDLFLFTNGADVPWVDTNGDAYIMANVGQDTTSMTLTMLLHIAFFFVAAIVGVALGLVYASYGAGRGLITAFSTFLMAVALYWAIEFPVRDWDTAAASGIYAACLVTLAVSAVAFRSTKRFVP
ncbi:hypothetical protein [Corynebacterium sp. NML180780]|uniref:hypothetical protein n=1 Tax=Corynebacterium sp. NML180780 TaxID=2598459 RepID=UPI00118F8636|nr:hypothetical protein [Corynebacterium sp. NML180780]TVX82475.1 hypothetical protein FPP74_00275 [Corynebacterium sp. NML180780]